MNHKQKQFLTEVRAMADRVMSRVDRQENGCLLFTGYKNSTGYGNIFWKGKTWKTHRIAYMAYKGEIPEGYVICHKCDTPACCNPEHLFLGTQKDNMRDMAAKGRGRSVRGQAHPNSKISDNDAATIRAMYGTDGVILKDLAVMYGISVSHTYRIVRGIQRAV